MEQIPKQAPRLSMDIKGIESAHMLSVATEGTAGLGGSLSDVSPEAVVWVTHSPL